MRCVSLFLFALSVGVLLAINVRADEPGGKAITPFNGKDLSGWKLKGPEGRSKWIVGKAVVDSQKPSELLVVAVEGEPKELVNAKGGGVDLYTEEKFGDCVIEVEFMVPKGSNSGIYVMGEYEIQVLDSFGREKLTMSDLGAIYSAAVPKINAAKKPGEWQKFIIDFQAPRFEDGKKTANARFVKVTLNDQVIHENVEIKGPTPSGVTGTEAATGPIMFQGDHGPVAYRGIKVMPKK